MKMKFNLSYFSSGFETLLCLWSTLEQGCPEISSIVFSGKI
uniref:Uncharacterized protein n=1 Tax=Rhizophora mucronata TaxID=61149 RepID=A0A2P2N1P1_RHIMU